MKGCLFRKNLVFTIVLLLFGLAFTSTISSQTPGNKSFIENVENTDKIEVQLLNFKSDGTVEKYSQVILPEIATELVEKVGNAKDLWEKVEIGKSFGLVPKDFSLEQCKKTVYERGVRILSNVRAVSLSKGLPLNLLCGLGSAGRGIAIPPYGPVAISMIWFYENGTTTTEGVLGNWTVNGSQIGCAFGFVGIIFLIIFPNNLIQLIAGAALFVFVAGSNPSLFRGLNR